MDAATELKCIYVAYIFFTVKVGNFNDYTFVDFHMENSFI